ncbi:OLC1v1019141C1 [Oldenlandia corymbosa var. corymbosa]|uniref:OLC1v1019141C1 n=1 Tax=Oldenlandia corymbosa var. corymbosa TaxID=529605 RepID=A0AAV1EDB4_OLDCO|nr:OLC1v1019141C1 [Oldenlandia corymbosa var. corymbosa]
MEDCPSSSSTPNLESDPELLMPDFPDEIAIEILSRLPAKSLGKFKCVAKPWLSLISSQGFIKTHLAVSAESDDFSHHRLILYEFTDNRFQHRLYSASSLLNEVFDETTAAAEVFNIDYIIQPYELFWLVDSCSGLVCLINMDRELILCNPCTKKFKKLPGSEIRKSNTLGFGYDSLNDDYKVVEFVDNKVNMYSVKTSSWRKIEDLEVITPAYDKPVHYVSGTFYWSTNDGVDDWMIASFDLGNETYGIMDRPPKNNDS